MFRIESLDVRQFRTVEPTKLEFSPGFTLILGKNGTGKTALLKLLEHVVVDDFSDAGAEPVDFVTTIKAHNTQRVASIAYSASQDEAMLAALHAHASRARLSFDDDSGADPLVWQGSTTSLKVQLGESVSFGPTPRTAYSLYGKLRVRPDNASWGHSGLGRLDEGLDTFRAMTDPDAGLTHVVTQKRPAPLPWFPIGGRSQAGPQITAALERASPEQSAWPTLEWTHTEDSALAAFMGMCGSFTHANVLSRLIESMEHRHSRQAFYGGLSFSFEAGRTAKFSHAQLSYGEKRLLGALYHANATGHMPLLADELVNGLHYDWISRLLEIISGEDQQIILTSQNPLLLNLVPVPSDDIQAVRRMFITCRRTTSGHLQWNNFSEEEASYFVRAYTGGIGHVSEILKDLELW